LGYVTTPKNRQETDRLLPDQAKRDRVFISSMPPAPTINHAPAKSNRHPPHFTWRKPTRWVDRRSARIMDHTELWSESWMPADMIIMITADIVKAGGYLLRPTLLVSLPVPWSVSLRGTYPGFQAIHTLPCTPYTRSNWPSTFRASHHRRPIACLSSVVGLTMS
jgi:hypothetical protein